MFKIIALPELLPEIKETAENGDLAIFMGAGLSRFLDCMSWKDLAVNLTKKCESENLINNYEQSVLANSNDFKKTITICNELLKDDKRFMKEMRNSLNDKDVKKYLNGTLKDKAEYEQKLQIYKNLFSLNAIFITTNADRHIDQVFASENIKVKDFGAATELDNNHLYKIHGSITDKESLVFTVDGYLNRYTNEGFGNFLEKIFATKTVLFIGYGLGEFELLDYLFKSIKSTGKQHYFLKDFYEHETNIYKFEQIYFKKLGIVLIPYSKDKVGFNQLPKIIEYWVDEMKIKSRVLQKVYDEIDQVLENPYE